MSATKAIRAMVLGGGILLGGLALAQGDVPPPTREGPAEPMRRGPSCPGGCPLCDAHAEATHALESGAAVTLEETPNGAVLRFEAPAGDPEAIEAARAAAEAYTRALQAPTTQRGCPCPRHEGGACPQDDTGVEEDIQIDEEEEVFP